MLRYIMRCRQRFMSGGERETYYTIDGNVQAVEEDLQRGGTSETEYEIRELVGVEVINDGVKEARRPEKEMRGNAGD